MLLRHHMGEYCYRSNHSLMRRPQYDRLSQQQLGILLLTVLQIYQRLTSLFTIIVETAMQKKKQAKTNHNGEHICT